MRRFFFVLNINLNTLTTDSKHLLDLWTIDIRTGIARSVLRIVRNLIFIVTIVQRCCHASSVRTELHVIENVYYLIECISKADINLQRHCHREILQRLVDRLHSNRWRRRNKTVAHKLVRPWSKRLYLDPDGIERQASTIYRAAYVPVPHLHVEHYAGSWQCHH